MHLFILIRSYYFLLFVGIFNVNIDFLTVFTSLSHSFFFFIFKSQVQVSRSWGANSTSTMSKDAAPRNFLDFSSQEPLGDIQAYEADTLPESVVKEDSEKNSLTDGTDSSDVS